MIVALNIIFKIIVVGFFLNYKWFIFKILIIKLYILIFNSDQKNMDEFFILHTWPEYK